MEPPGIGRLEELEIAGAALCMRWTASGIAAAVADADADGPAIGIESFIREGPAIDWMACRGIADPDAT